MSNTATLSISQLADRLGVSATTVSRVLNHRKGIGPGTRQRVWDAARQAGYRPKQSVRRRTIGLLIDHADPQCLGGFATRLTTNIMAALAQHDLSLEVFSRGNLSAIGNRYLDGILAIAWEDDSINALRSATGVPIVIFNRPEYPEFSNVCADYREGGKMVARAMLERGHRNIGFLSVLRDQPVRTMLAGFTEQLAEGEVQLPPHAVAFTEFQPAAPALKRLVDQQITALWVCHPEITYEVPYLCSEVMGMDLPRALSLIGNDDTLRHTYSRPPMTILSEDVDNLIQQALDMLMAQINDNDPTPRQSAVPMTLTIRESLQDIRRSQDNTLHV